METIKPLLAEHPMFKDLAPQYLELLVGCASNVRWDEGEFINRDGEESNTFSSFVTAPWRSKWPPPPRVRSPS